MDQPGDRLRDREYAGAGQLHLEDFQGFTCTACGLCCTRPWGVPIEPEVEAGIRQSELFARREREGYIPLEMHAVGGNLRAGRQHNGDCMFLMTDTACGLHNELGNLRKPVGCQIYPYRAVRTPSGTFFSQSWVCPPVVAGLDRNAQQNLTELAAVLELYPEAAVALPDEDFPVPVYEGLHISWADYLQLEQGLLAAYDPDDVMNSLLGMAVHLSHARMDPRSFAEAGLRPWQALSSDDLDFERELLVIYLSAIISIVEQEHDHGLRDGVRQALIAGEGVTSTLLGVVLPILDLKAPLPPLLRDAFHRYFRNAVAGKTLLVPSVVRQLLKLAMAHAMMVFYAEAFRIQLDEAELSLKSLTLAFEIVDGELSHNQALEPFFLDFERMLLRLANPE